jgi:hypothetical protein
MIEKMKTSLAYAAAFWLQIVAWFQNPHVNLSFEQWMALLVAVPSALHMCIKIYETWKNIKKNHP